jgi:hypothetical protein
VSRWLLTAHAGSSLADFSTMKMEVIRSSESSVHTRSTRCHIPEDGTLPSHCRENLKSYINIINSNNRIQSNRLNCIHCIERKEHEGILNQLMWCKPKATRSTGRPKLRLKDQHMLQRNEKG